jgi:Xaa-Pro aminopeptidase
MEKLKANEAVIMAGIPAANASLFRKIRFSVGDPVAYVETNPSNGAAAKTLILRDIEMERARESARVDQVSCPADFAPAAGLSGDRETATAQATAECLRRAGVTRAIADRTLPFIFAEIIRASGIEVACDMELGATDRRAKDEQEITFLREAQGVTEDAVRMVCECVSRADAEENGQLIQDGAPLTSERLRAMVDVWFIERGYSNPGSIIAGGPQGADCHNTGSGILYTGQPVIVDIFPSNNKTRYNGDCTRTVVHGEFSDTIRSMHAAVQKAKTAGIASIRAGTTGEAVHVATKKALKDEGYAFGLPDADTPDEYCAMTHGTGHGVGLELHEPPLLDMKGPELVVGDVLTVEPGLYSKAIGGVRLEDMVVVTADGCENLNRLPEDLTW